MRVRRASLHTLKPFDSVTVLLQPATIIPGMAFSTVERVAHVYRRLGVGAYPDLIATTDTVEEAIERALDLSQQPPELVSMEPPMDREAATDIATLAAPVQSWLSSMVTSPRLIEERLVWFWHDHFATAIQKVRIPYLMWIQHQTIRQHATGSFADLLRGIATDPAMLFYLDGARSHSEQVNENYAREVMELHTMGTGNYTQTDVTEAARALTGWVVYVPYGRAAERFGGTYEPWQSLFAPFRHDQGTKSVLGTSGDLDLDDVLDVLLDQEATARFVSGKLWVELVGIEAQEPTLEKLADAFRSNYSIMDLVEAIVSDPVFVSDEAIRSKIRTPVERLVAISQGFGGDTVDERLGFTLNGMSFLPFNPPSPAGFPAGRVLLGPHQMIHSFDLLAVGRAGSAETTDQIAARIGLADISEATRSVLDMAPDPETKTALAVNSPEFALV